MDVAEELKRRFLAMYFFIMEGCEFAPGYVITDEEYATADLFDRMHDEVDAIPENVLGAAEALIARIEPLVFERHLEDALYSVGSTSFPNSAAEFLQSVNHALLLEADIAG